MAQLVVTAVLVEGRSKSEVARTSGVSRRWVIALVQRFLAEGEPGLQPRSRRPQRSPAGTPQCVEDEIVACSCSQQIARKTYSCLSIGSVRRPRRLAADRFGSP